MKQWLIGVGVVFASIISMFFYGRKAGKDKAEAKQTKEQYDELQKANEASFNASNRSSSERKRRMLNRNSKQ